MAGAALVRSAASKIVRTPPRLLVQEGLQHQGRGPSYRRSSYSTSGASTPPPTNHRGPQTHNKKVFNEWDVAKAAAMEFAPKVAYFTTISSWMFIYFWVIPKLDHMKKMLDAAATEKLAMKEEIKRCHKTIHDLFDSKSVRS